MHLSKILFPTDFSHCGDAALDYATSLARDMGAVLVIAHVEEPPATYGGGDIYYGAPEPDEFELRRRLAAVLPTDRDVPFEHRLITGDPATAIINLAEMEGADLIVMGTHGRTGFSRLLMGSVAEMVVRKAHCPVLTFRQPAHHAVPA